MSVKVIVNKKMQYKEVVKILKKFLELYEKKLNNFDLLLFFCKVDNTWVKNCWELIFGNF